jgi:hypothetical protein
VAELRRELGDGRAATRRSLPRATQSDHRGDVTATAPTAAADLSRAIADKRAVQSTLALALPTRQVPAAA